MEIELRSDYAATNGFGEWKAMTSTSWQNSLASIISAFGPGATISVGVPRLNGEIDTHEYRARQRKEFIVEQDIVISTAVHAMAYDEEEAREIADTINWDEDEEYREHAHEHIVEATITDFHDAEPKNIRTT